MRGLHDEEVTFLDYVSKRQEELQSAKEDEDKAVIDEYKVRSLM